MGFFSNLFKQQEEAIELEPVDMSLIKADMHAHLLPAIDDGSKSLEDSLELITGLKDLGYSQVLATPHVMYDFYKNSTDTILSKLDDVREVLSKNNIAIDIDVAAEYYFDEELQNRLHKKDLLTFGKEDYLLFEFSYFNEHNGVYGVLSEMFEKGYTPVLAHPERYPYFVESPEKYNELKEMGVKFQINLLSLVGHYGESAVHGSSYLIDNNFVDFVGSDIHRVNHLPSLKESLRTEPLHKLVNSGSLLNHSLLEV
jgi:tyrosine-protein phosphatase YwqE